MQYGVQHVLELSMRAEEDHGCDDIVEFTAEHCGLQTRVGRCSASEEGAKVGEAERTRSDDMFPNNNSLGLHAAAVRRNAVWSATAVVHAAPMFRDSVAWRLAPCAYAQFPTRDNLDNVCLDACQSIRLLQLATFFKTLSLLVNRGTTFSYVD